MSLDYLELWRPGRQEMFGLDGKRATIGTASAADLRLDDPTVSYLHAVLDQLGAGWTIRDLDSTNGTIVNGRRITGERPLRHGDDLRLGDSHLVFRSTAGEVPERTLTTLRAPELTRREREVLNALCRPLLSGDVFTEPASIRQMASELYVSEAAVKHHLVRLYGKFGVHETGERRRVRLANEALNRGAVNLADLRRT